MIKLAVGTLVGVLVGALLGGLVFRALAGGSTATAFIRVLQPVDLVVVAASAAQSAADMLTNSDQYVSGEVAYLSGDGFAQAVARKVGETGTADFSVQQDGESSVLAISSSADSADGARRIVQAVVDVYAQQLAQRVDRQLRTILPTLDDWEASATAAQDLLRVQEIRRLRENVLLQGTQANQMLLLQPPTVSDDGGGQWIMGAVLGALLGGAAVPLVMAARRRSSGRLTGAADVIDAVDGVLLPTVDLRLPGRHSWRDQQVSLARTLLAQCPSPGPGRVIVLVGASPSSGTSVVAALLQFASAERGAVTTSILSRDPVPLPPSEDENRTVIVDAGALGESKLTTAALALATDVIVVAKLDCDTVAEVLAVRSAATSAKAPLLAVLTYRSSRKPKVAKEGTQHEPDPPTTPDAVAQDPSGPAGTVGERG